MRGPGTTRPASRSATVTMWNYRLRVIEHFGEAFDGFAFHSVFLLDRVDDAPAWWWSFGANHGVSGIGERNASAPPCDAPRLKVGFSWLDLYAIGLADASEVPNTFVLHDLRAVTKTSLGDRTPQKRRP